MMLSPLSSTDRWAQCPETNALLCRAWQVLDDDVKLLRELCDAAVQGPAASGGLDRGVAHLGRAMLCWPLQSVAELRADVEAWQYCAQSAQVPERLRRLGIAARGFLFRREGKHELAMACFESLPLLSTEAVADPDDHFVLYGLGLTAVSLSRFEAGIAAHAKAMELAERTGCKVRICTVANALGTALANTGRHAQKLELLDGVLQRDILPSANPRLVLMLRANRALALSDLGHQQQAFDALHPLEPEVKVHAPGMLILLFMNLCELAMDLNRLDEARQYLAQAYEQAYLRGDLSNIGCCHVDAGRLARLEGRLHDAVQALHLAAECRELRPEGNGNFNEIDHWLSLCYAELGCYDLAYQHQCLHHSAHVKRAAEGELGMLASRAPGSAAPSPPMLSARELECVQWCVAGKTAWETGAILGLSEWTVVYHLGRARKKMGVSSKQQLVAVAVSQGMAATGAGQAGAAGLELARAGHRRLY